jgi:hypothetical protein
MLRQPKLKPNKYQQVYKLTFINNALLSFCCLFRSLHTNSQNYWSSELFNSIFDRFKKNLDNAILLLNDDKNKIPIDYQSNENLNNSFIELLKIREKELLQGIEPKSETFKIKIKESQLVIEQLI